MSNAGAAGRGLAPLDLAARRLGWLDRRQVVLAQNIANADTPDYRPHDLTPFARALAAATPPGLARTAPGHLAGGGRAGPGATADRSVAEAVPDGNAVSLDREAVRMAETDTAHALAMAVHRSFTGLYRLALGRQG
ncbi:flagellar biosynthesis protein FlgB [Roseomonas sp. BU-1]|uniref:Flagellar biosynthesis protein FlgB n=2 Tax=Falsiroseomonas selenitidurans TaxID=2716335 RepID=A0ABX1E9G1_9PROT|nr:flagellar biosynthesis protein FlgB [Falsiroseomonas selenitidurans]